MAPPTHPSSEEEYETSCEEEETSSDEEETSSEEEENQPTAIVTKPQAATFTKPQSKASSSESKTESDSESDSEDDAAEEVANPIDKPPILSNPTEVTLIANKMQPSTTLARSPMKRLSEKNEAVSQKRTKNASRDDRTTENGRKNAEEEPNDAAKEVANPIVKPSILSKPMPMEGTLKAKKMQPSTRPVSSAMKRLSDKNHSPKRTKNASRDVETRTTENVRKNAEEEPKKLVQRRWSEDDVIALLKGMIFFMEKMGLNPCKQINDFYDFVKEFMHIDVGKDQLLSKIQRMKKTYVSVIANIRKNGTDTSLNKPHNMEAFELSKKIWGIGGESGRTVQAKSTKKDEKVQKKGNNINQIIDSSLTFIETIRFDKHLRLAGLCKDHIMKGLELLEPSQRAELDSLWYNLQDAELDLFLKRMDLITRQTIMIKEALREEFNRRVIKEGSD